MVLVNMSILYMFLDVTSYTNIIYITNTHENKINPLLILNQTLSLQNSLLSQYFIKLKSSNINHLN